MSEKSDYKYAAVRMKILTAVRTDLIGPTSDEEILTEMPTSSYITGLLYPADSTITEDENYNEVEFIEKNFDAHGETAEASIFEDDEPEEKSHGGFQKPSSIGVSFYIDSNVKKLNANILWGRYHVDKIQEGEHIDKSLEEDTENKRKRKKLVYVREQMNDVVEIDLSSISRSARIPLTTNSNIYIYVIQLKLDNGYTMLSVYLHNNDEIQGEEKEYEKVMFQVEMCITDDEMNPIFVPEYICRKSELEDEYYFKGRPVFARGRGCAAVWNQRTEEINAYAVRTSFIPDYEIASVSAQVKDVPQNAFSMFLMGSEKRKEETIQNLKLLTELYQNWIDTVLKTNPEMGNKEFANTTGAKIIAKCEKANERMMTGIYFIESNERAYKAFVFMNLAMYMQRSIADYAKKSGKGIPCSLSDFMKEDHSEWRPFQIAFILLNICSIADMKSLEREIVDLLYFPTGGGKTEAYLGLIAFTVAYRRLTASEELEYEKDGGVAVFLRYTLRLLTTQQRDRLLKLVVAMEMIREKSEKNGKALYGHEKITIGFWVGGGVTPNNFNDIGSDIYKEKDFYRKLTKQIIKCPCCGREITKSEYQVNKKAESVEIHCANDNCYFSYKSGRTLPVYLVDDEIYAKCPTVIISTVDKFARLPWSEKVGLLFGKTDRYCTRHGHLAVGDTSHPKRHNADKEEKLPAATVEECRPFYPPELIIQDELHLITGPLGTIYGGYETVVEDMCRIERDGRKIRPKYVVSTATIKNAGEQIRCLYARENYEHFPPSGIDIRDSYFIKEVPLPTCDVENASRDEIDKSMEQGEKPFRQYAGICASGQSVKTTLIRLYSIILQKVFDLANDAEYGDYVDPYYTLIGYFNSIRELGGAVRLLDDDIESRIRVVKNHYGSQKQRFLSYEGRKEITSRIPSYEIANVLEKLAISYDKKKVKQECYDVVIATNMIAVGMDVDRLGLMSVVGQPKQNSEYIQATSRVGRKYPGIIFTVYNPYRPRDLSNYENFVGFHSQMYRYVEGTTATPFAARARDRVLHALVVSLLRLQIKKMADNKGASNVTLLTDDEIGNVKKTILDRVAIVSSTSTKDTEEEMDRFISIWKDIANDKLFYFIPNTADDKRRLLTFYGEYYGVKEKPTLNSMRDVEQSSTLFYWEGI